MILKKQRYENGKREIYISKQKFLNITPIN